MSNKGCVPRCVPFNKHLPTIAFRLVSRTLNMLVKKKFEDLSPNTPIPAPVTLYTIHILWRLEILTLEPDGLGLSPSSAVPVYILCSLFICKVVRKSTQLMGWL